MKPLTIGKVASQADIGVETIRFYEREGLIENPPRRQSGYRQYEPGVVDRLRFIRRAKDLGFTLREIKELLELRLDPSSTCGDVKGRAEQKIAAIQVKLRELQRMKRALGRLVAACDGKTDVEHCPILTSLDR